MRFTTFNRPLFTFSKKMKHWNLDNCLLSNWWRLLYWKGPLLNPSPPSCSNDFWKLLSLRISINWSSFVALWAVVQKIYLKMHLVLCTNFHYDVTDLVNYGVVKNAKTWISSEQNIAFLWNRKILNLCLKWHTWEDIVL